MKIILENALFFKIIFYLAPKGQTLLKYTKIWSILKEKNPESIGTSFLKVHWLEPKLFQFKNLLQLKSSNPDWNLQEGKILVGTIFLFKISLVLIKVSLKMKYQ